MADKEGEKLTVEEGDANLSGGPSEDYEKLQRQLKKERAKNRDLNRKLADASEAKAAALRVEELVLQRFAGEGEEEAVGKAKTRRDAESKAFQYYRELQEVVDEAGADWEDERLAPALKAWEGGRHAEAVATARAAVKGEGISETAIEERVTKAVQAALRQAGMKVDMSTPTAPAPSSSGVRMSELEDFFDPHLLSDPKALKSAADALMKKAYKLR